MRLWRSRAYSFGLVGSVMLFVSTVAAATCTIYFDLPFSEGLWIGHRELVLWQDGADIRFAAQDPMPIFGLATTDEGMRDLADGIGFDTNPRLRWLTLPRFEVSLWWPFTLSLVLPAIHLTRRSRTCERGFPVLCKSGL